MCNLRIFPKQKYFVNIPQSLLTLLRLENFLRRNIEPKTICCNKTSIAQLNALFKEQSKNVFTGFFFSAHRKLFFTADKLVEFKLKFDGEYL